MVLLQPQPLEVYRSFCALHAAQLSLLQHTVPWTAQVSVA